MECPMLSPEPGTWEALDRYVDKGLDGHPSGVGGRTDL